MSRFFSFSFFLCALILPSVSSQAAGQKSVHDKVMEKREISCGYFTWAPFFVKDPNTGIMSGINYEFMEEIGKVLGVKIKWAEEVSAAAAIEGLNTGRYDVMCATLWPDQHRVANSLMSNPQFHDTVNVVVRSDDHRFDSGFNTINLPDVTIAGIDGDVTYTVAIENFPKAKILALPQTSNGSDLLINLAAKKADVVILDRGSVADFNKSNENLVRVVESLPPVKTFDESLAVRKGEDKLMEELNRALRILKETGVSERIVGKYKAYEFSVPEYGDRK